MSLSNLPILLFALKHFSNYVNFELASGVYILPNGEIYQGELLNGKRHGRGMYM